MFRFISPQSVGDIVHNWTQWKKLTLCVNRWLSCFLFIHVKAFLCILFVSLIPVNSDAGNFYDSFRDQHDCDLWQGEHKESSFLSCPIQRFKGEFGSIIQWTCVHWWIFSKHPLFLACSFVVHHEAFLYYQTTVILDFKFSHDSNLTKQTKNLF